MHFASEKAFTDAAVDLFKAYGWRVMHMRGNTFRLIQGHSGYPDLTCAKDGRVLFLELKMPKGKMTPEQDAWATVLWPNHRLLHPEDWDWLVTLASGQ